MFTSLDVPHVTCHVSRVTIFNPWAQISTYFSEKKKTSMTTTMIRFSKSLEHIQADPSCNLPLSRCPMSIPLYYLILKYWCEVSQPEISKCWLFYLIHVQREVQCIKQNSLKRTSLLWKLQLSPQQTALAS